MATAPTKLVDHKRTSANAQRSVPAEPLLRHLIAFLVLYLSSFQSVGAQGPDPIMPQIDARLDQARLLIAILSVLLIGYLAYSWRLRRNTYNSAVALASAREGLEHRGRALHALLELGHTLTGARDMEAITEHIVSQIRKGTGFDRVGLYFVDEKRETLRGVTGVNEHGEIEDCSRFVFPLDEEASPMVQVARGDREYYLTEDAEKAIGTEKRVKHNAFVPLRTPDRVLGVIAVDNLLTGRPFGEDEVRELRGFADEVALAFHNTRLLTRAEEQQAALADRNRELSALVAFSHSSTSARTVDEVVHAIWSTVKEGFGFDRVGIFLKEGDTIRGVIGTGEDGQIESSRDLSWPVESSTGRWLPLLVGERDYNYSRCLTDEEGVRTRTGKPIKEHILVALRTQEQVIGAIAVDNFVSGRAIAEEDARPLVAFARQAATALQSVTLLEALQSSEERLRVLVTSLSETLYSAKVSGVSLVPVFYSPRIEQLTGYTLDEALASPDFWPRLVHHEDRDRYKNGLRDIMQGASLPIEYRIVHRSGETRWVLDTPAPVRDETGNAIRINGALLDITERKSLEESLRRAQKMETVGTLAGGIAHEFNNLLGIIMGNIEFAQLDAGPDNPAQRSLEQTRKAVARAADLTKQLLTFSAKIDSRRSTVYLDKVVEETVGLLNSSLGKSIQVETDLRPDLEEVSADSSQIQQVLINLCVNARDAMPDGGSIHISAQPAVIPADHPSRPPESPTGHYSVLSVTDTGKGMDARTQERIFEPFFTTKPVGRGTGLGLAVAYGIVTEHLGWIEVESEPGHGTTFQVYLPCVSATSGAQSEPEGLPPTALVVEASPSARSTLIDILEGLGYSTLTAATASEALAIFWTDSDMVDLVVSDSRPAGMDVEQLIANFRDFKPDVPILVGAPAQNGTSQSLNGLAASVIRKPYDAEEIARAAGVHPPISRD
jgi:PAS domain S-box-containing protein